MDGSDVLHKDFHGAIKKKACLLTEILRDPEELVGKLNKAYEKVPQKGTLKIPRTVEVLAKNVTIGEALNKSMGKGANLKAAGGR